jgi:flagellar assembly protein FliH
MKSFRKTTSSITDAASAHSWVPLELPDAVQTPGVLAEISKEELLNLFKGRTSLPAVVSTTTAEGDDWLPGVEIALRIEAWFPQQLNGDAAIEEIIDPEPPSEPAASPDPNPAFSEDGVEYLHILETAQRQADEILSQARLDAEEAILQGHKDGWAAAEAETGSIVQTAMNIVEQVSAWREEMIAQSESVVIEMVKEIAKKLFVTGFELDREVLKQTYTRVVENARSLGDLSIYANPDDAVNLDPFWREFQVNLTGHQIQIIPSAAITRGGCYVQGQMGTVDGRIETQLKAILDTFGEDEAKGGSA